MKIAIASKNINKIMPIQKAFEDFFGATVVTDGFEVSSEVSEQPCDLETFKGAENRLNNLKKLICAENYEFLVSCEAGLLQLNGHYFNVQVVMIESTSSNSSCVGLSQSYPIPDKYIDSILKGSLAEVLDSLFQGRGGIRALTRGKLTRSDLIEQATLMSLSGYNW